MIMAQGLQEDVHRSFVYFQALVDGEKTRGATVYPCSTRIGQETINNGYYSDPSYIAPD